MNTMWDFLKKLHLTVFALSMIGAIIVFIIVIIILFTGGESNANSVLKISLNSPLVEHAPSSEAITDKLDLPFTNFESKVGVINTVQALKKAKTDNDIKSVFLELGMIQGGLGQVEEIRNAVLDFKTSGKKVVAYGDYFDEKAYYLASAADSVYLTSEAILEFNGFVAEVNFYKKTLKSIGIQPKIFRVGKFKGAVEPFMLDSISNENELQITEFLNSLHSTLLSQIASSRNIEFEKLKNISDNLLVRNAYQAVEHKLIDGVKYYDEVLSVIREVSGISESEKINFVLAESYWETPMNVTFGDQIAVIVADGDIGMGENKDGSIGSNGTARLIREARLDPQVKAIVLRINSPGGSALGSDIMWREILKASEMKPIIASMSSLAASGGYYMAMACDTIVAHESTITGSIGVFGMLFNAEDLLKNKMGIHTDRVKTGKFSDLGTPTRQMTVEDSLIIQTEVNTIYQSFITKAAQGRGMTVEALDAVASGRVWSGKTAKAIGLVDLFGDLDDAIKIAAEKAKCESYATVYYPTINAFWGTLEKGYKQTALPEELKELKSSDVYQYYQQINKFSQMKGVQARAPYDLIIK
jgi:protease IV